MAKDSSFDVVSQIDMQEVDNAFRASEEGRFLSVMTLKTLVLTLH